MCIHTILCVEVKLYVIAIKFDGEKYRTKEYNQMLDLIFQETNKLRWYGEKESEKSEAVSHSVPRPRIELGTKL